MKITSLFLLILFTSVLFTACKKDDMPGPNAKVFGIIKDKATGLPVETDLINGSSIEAFELGYATPVSQRWVIKPSGEYRNNLVFANDYDFKLQNGNFFPITVTKVSVHPGDNLLDFEVEPYIRIKDCKITYDATGKKVTATFNLEAGNAAVKLKTIRLYAFSDIYVGESTKFSTTGTGYNQAFSPSKIIDNSSFTLSIDLAANASLFPGGRAYFFRVGALADISGVGTVRYNYAPNVKIML